MALDPNVVPLQHSLDVFTDVRALIITNEI